MRVIETKTHGYIDYLTGMALIAAPFIFNLDRSTAEGMVPMILGIGTILYSLMTAYELGIANVLSMKAHLMIDVLSGLFLAASPWIFDFADRVYLPHLIVGIAEVAISLMTKTEVHSTSVNKGHSHKHAHGH